MALLNLPAQVVRLGFAQNFISTNVNEEFFLVAAQPTTVSISVDVPRQILVSSVAFTLQTIPSVSVDRECHADLLLNDEVVASYSFRTENDVPQQTQSIADQQLTFPTILFAGDTYTWRIVNDEAPLVGAEVITFRGTISVQGTPI